MHNQGDILLVPIPFTDFSTSKKRPVLVISKKSYNTATDDLIVAAITSNSDKKPYIVNFTNKDMTDGVLKVASYIRADKIYTISQNIVVKRFGKVTSETVAKVKGKLFKALDES